MSISEILKFLSEVKSNNNREWFAAHKDIYLAAKSEFESVVVRILDELTLYDESLVGLRPSDCIFRFYRDIRFSSDKSPYKRHFGAYICRDGGRKSKYAGCYFHLEPGCISLIGGLWAPDSRILKKVRNSIVDNYEELCEIMSDKEFRYYFDDMVSYEMTSRVPAGFDKAFEGAEYLKYKHFLIERRIADDEVDNPGFVDGIIKCFKAMKRFNDFINYTIEE